MKTLSDICQNKLNSDLEFAITEVYQSIPYGKIASIISEYHDTKISDTLIENYLQQATSRKLSFDPVVLEIRKLNKFDNTVFEGNLEFVLNDGSTVVMSHASYKELNEALETLGQNDEVVNFILDSKDNLMKVFEVLNKNKGK